MKILHFADLHLGVETYGHLDPATGLSSRQADFLRVFDEIVDCALERKVDLVLFCGDAYKSREPTQTQQREFARRIRRLSEGGVPIFLLTGNHDLPGTTFRASSTEIFDTLGVSRVYVVTKPGLHLIRTAGGPLQIASLPWPRRSALLTREEARNLSFDAIKQRIETALTVTVAQMARQVNPQIPAVLAAHIWVAGAVVGSESRMTIGQDPTLLLSNVAIQPFDYVALGHIHRRQVLSEQPPVVYAGSPERLDFGEGDTEKGFYLIDITTDAATGERVTRYAFQPTGARNFLTLNVKIEDTESDPTEIILKAISESGDKIRDAVVRVEMELSVQNSTRIREADIREKLKEASYFSLNRNVRREFRQRLGGKSAEEITPQEALRAYFAGKKISPERLKKLLEYGDNLIRKRGEQG